MNFFDSFVEVIVKIRISRFIANIWLSLIFLQLIKDYRIRENKRNVWSLPQ